MFFTFVGVSPDDVKTGIQPFIIVEGSSEHRQANLEVAGLYGLLNSGEPSIMLSDLEQLKTKELKALPMQYFKLERNLGMFGNLLGTVLGTRHALTTAYRAFWQLLSQGYHSEFQQIIDVKLYIKPAHILRSIQLVCYNWFTQRRARLQPQQPEFTFIIYNVILNTYVLPNLPHTIYKLAYPRQTNHPQSIGGDTPSTVSLTSANSVTSSVSGITSSSFAPSLATGMQSLQHRQGQQSSQGRRKGSFQANLHPDRSLAQLIDYGMTRKDLIGNEAPPTLDDGSPICLAFYVRNGCWSNCKCVNLHNRKLSPTEKAKLESYITHRTAALCAAASTRG